MNDPDDGEGDDVTASHDTDPLTAAAQHKRRARVFGEVLPEVTSDERGDAWGDRDGTADEWLRRQVPPHHG